MARAADNKGGAFMGSTLWLVLFIVLWFVMNKWVLPKLGVPT